MIKQELEFYENTDFGDELYGTRVSVHPDESAFDVIKRLRSERKKEQVGLRLASGLKAKIKAQAAAAGIPWTTYIGMLLEQAMAKQQTQPAQPQTV